VANEGTTARHDKQPRRKWGSSKCSASCGCGPMVLRWDYTRRRRNAHRHVLGIRSLVARRTRVDQSRGRGHRPRPRLCVVAKARQVVFAHGCCGDCGRPGKIGAMLSGPTETAGRKATKRLESPAIAVARSGCRMPVTSDHPLCQLWDHSERRPKMSSQGDRRPDMEGDLRMPNSECFHSRSRPSTH
jgi:hypothetical protein